MSFPIAVAPDRTRDAKTRAPLAALGWNPLARRLVVMQLAVLVASVGFYQAAGLTLKWDADALLCCLVLMLSLPLETWIRFVVWLAIGLAIYFFYGRRRAAV